MQDLETLIIWEIKTGAKTSKVQRRMISPSEPDDSNIAADTDKFVSGNTVCNLTVGDPMVTMRSGRYRCVVNKEVVRVYELHLKERKSANS
ncbi:hypothetical protein RvY_02768 [Ramazzottius varieornatus]|uniref:Uncharacterized protein n=1 Tax=Ramazzottius varieornatus TaxID=947166 RepID=A0A1D1UKV5_RAMVA|nr:hypothetical protein RvY_02768 [Ramazzottius varieornatus]